MKDVCPCKHRIVPFMIDTYKPETSANLPGLGYWCYTEDYNKRKYLPVLYMGFLLNIIYLIDISVNTVFTSITVVLAV